MAILYRSGFLYHALMTLVYRSYRDERFEAVARWVPEGASVLDVCCGDGALAKHLPDLVSYRGLDQSSAFALEAQRQGRQVEQFDLRHGVVPMSNVVVCQVSLFQFYPDVEAVLAKLFDAAQQRLIISESVLSLTQSKWRWLANLVAWGTDPNGMSDNRFRFNPESLQKLFSPYQSHIRDARKVCGGRDWVYVLDKSPGYD